jgi:membrane protein YdbS with pleckstrin-like domain
VTGLVVVIVMLGGAACGIVLFAAGLQQLAIAVAAVIVVSIVSSALTEIFRVAVYQYAVTGATPGAFDNALLQNAFDGCTHQR